jgi:prophage maintenance system killer protein
MNFTHLNILSFLFLSLVLLPNAEAGGNRNLQHTSRSVSASKMAQQQTKIALQQARHQKKQKDSVFSFSPQMNLNHPWALPLIGLILTAHMLSADAKLVPTHPPKIRRLGFVASQPPSNCTIVSVSPTAPWPEHVTHVPHAGIYVSESNFFESIQCVQDAVHDAIPESMFSILPGESPSHLIANARPSLLPLVQEITRSAAIDGFSTYSDPVDGKRWQNALDYIDSNLIEQPLEEMSFDTFESHFFNLNRLLRDSKKLPTYRSMPVTIRKKPALVPQFENVEAMRAYLKENDPGNLDIYNSFVSEISFISNLFPEMKVTAASEFRIWRSHVAMILLDPDSDPKAYSFCRAYYQLEDSDPKTLKKRLRSDFAKFKSLLKQDKTIDAAACIHQAIVKHHVFEDGNGGTARAMLEATLKQKGISPITFWSDEHYKTAVNKALEEGSLDPFIDYIRAEVCRSQSLASSSSAPLDDALLTCHAPHCQDNFDKELIKIGILHPARSEDEDYLTAKSGG